MPIEKLTARVDPSPDNDEELDLEAIAEALSGVEGDVKVDGDTKTKQLYIIGEINEEVSKIVLRTCFDTDWDKEGITNLNVYIASEGGYLKDCFAMIDAFDFVRETFGITITTFGLGEVASSGFFLFLAGDIRIMFPNCKAFVHEHIAPMGEQTYGERKRDDKDQKVLYDMYVQYCARRMEISPTKTKNLLKKNRFLTAKELVSYNVITPMDDDDEQED